MLYYPFCSSCFLTNIKRYFFEKLDLERDHFNCILCFWDINYAKETSNSDKHVFWLFSPTIKKKEYKKKSNNDISDFDTFISPFLFLLYNRCELTNEVKKQKFTGLFVGNTKKTLGTTFPCGFSIAAKCVLLLKQGNIIGLFFVSYKKENKENRRRRNKNF